VSAEVKAALEAACPSCAGVGTFAAFVDRDDGTGCYDPAVPCPRCKTSGRVPIEQLRWAEAGAVYRKARVARGESLMEAAQRLGLSPAAVSAMEQGRSDPAELAAAVTAAAQEGGDE